MLKLAQCDIVKPPAARVVSSSCNSTEVRIESHQAVKVDAQLSGYKRWLVDARVARPRKILNGLQQTVVNTEDKLTWLEKARINAIAGACPGSHQSALSGMRCWVAFADHFLGKKGKEFPPTTEGLQAWSNTFRCNRTYKIM